MLSQDESSVDLLFPPPQHSPDFPASPPTSRPFYPWPGPLAGTQCAADICAHLTGKYGRHNRRLKDWGDGTGPKAILEVPRRTGLALESRGWRWEGRGARESHLYRLSRAVAES